MTYGDFNNTILCAVQRLHAEDVSPRADENAKVACRQWCPALKLTSNFCDDCTGGHEADGEEEEVEDDEED